MLQNNDWSPCDACKLSVKHDGDVREGTLSMEAFIAELTTRLINDGVLDKNQSPLLKRLRTVTGYHCPSCKMPWRIVTVDDVGSTILWEPLSPSN